MTAWHAAADAKDGLAAAEKGMEQRLLLLVSYRVDGQAAVLHRLPVPRGMKIPAAGEQQAVAAPRKAGGVTTAGEHADTAGKRQAFAVQRGLLPLHGQIACNAPCRNENHGCCTELPSCITFSLTVDCETSILKNVWVM